MSDIDHHLRGQVNRLTEMVVQMNRDLHVDINDVSGRVDHVKNEQVRARSDLEQIRDELREFVRVSERTANVQQAATDIVALEANLEQEFGHYKKVRRTAVGLLQAFDTGLVSEETVRVAGEELMIETPRYWLAPALVALGSWAADDRKICEQAISEAFKRSPARTSLMFSLVLRRQNRLESSVRWLHHYLRAQDPEGLGREFAIILESTSQGAFGAAGRGIVQETLSTWRNELLHDDAAQVARWTKAVETHRGSPCADAFPTLAAVSPQWDQLEAGLRSARANPSLVKHYRALEGTQTSPPAAVEDAVDDILDRLVGEYDSEELPLRRELRYKEQIRSNGGDLTAARTAADADNVALEETIDYLTLQSTAALAPEAIGVSTATQKVALASCTPWFADAHGQFCRDYRAALPEQVRVRLTHRSSFEGHEFTLSPWEQSLDQPLEQLKLGLRHHWERRIATFLDKFTYNTTQNSIVLAVVCVLVFIFLTAVMSWVGSLIALGVAGVWGFAVHQKHTQAVELKGQASRILDAEQRNSERTLVSAHTELTEFWLRYGEADTEENGVRAVIDDLSKGSHSAPVFEQRAVTIQRENQ
ncbi:hypothetical protein [Nocardiopsis valliformis]|uniref:hypothetical protein n=1 Tax=Nocardiopsis valliformis TaxID=239974 RepID=UPI00034887E6|nr:hypothetical protein [Nocardiopsis valliformis]